MKNLISFFLFSFMALFIMSCGEEGKRLQDSHDSGFSGLNHADFHSIASPKVDASYPMMSPTTETWGQSNEREAYLETSEECRTRCLNNEQHMITKVCSKETLPEKRRACEKYAREVRQACVKRCG